MLSLKMVANGSFILFVYRVNKILYFTERGRHSDMLRKRATRHGKTRRDDVSQDKEVRKTKPVESNAFMLQIQPIAAWLLLAAIRMMSAWKSPISDCDETFNYWEPMHFLLHGHGLQTWEYSPEFALRSYAYLYPYAAVAKAAFWLSSHLVHPMTSKLVSFYAVRVAQGLICAAAETKLYKAVDRRFGRRIAFAFFTLLLSSPGIFRSSVEFLPSSFSMICLMAAYAHWLDDELAMAVTYVAVASLLGWIFAAIMGIPLAVYMLCSKRRAQQLLLSSVVSGVLLGLCMTAADSWHYGRLVFAPLNHILYNVFPAHGGGGSQLYGVEPLSYYAKNLFLNCNLSAMMLPFYPLVLALLAMRHGARGVWLRLQMFGGMYVALAVFGWQAHKEERFLVPCYPFIALMGATGITDMISFIPLPEPLHATVHASFVLGSVLLGVSRTAMQLRAFAAPLQIYHTLSQELRDSPPDTNVCIGKEWYRFGGSFFLHRGTHVRFLYAGFDGLLPRPFTNGTRATHAWFNDANQATNGQFYDVQRGHCHYWVDLDLDAAIAQGLASRDQGIVPAARRIIADAPFLDSAASPVLLRAFHIPGISRRLRVVRYVLVRNEDMLAQ